MMFFLVLYSDFILQKLEKYVKLYEPNQLPFILNWFGYYGVCVFCASASVGALFVFMKKIKICVFKNEVLYPANSVLYHELIEKNFKIGKIFYG